MTTTFALLDQAPTVLAAADGVFDWAGEKIQALEVLFRAFAVVAAVFFVIYRAIVTKGAFSAIVIAGVAAAVFVYIVWNVTDLQQRVDTEVNSAPAGDTQLSAVTPQPDAAVAHAA